MILEATIDPITRGISFSEEPVAGETDIDVTAIRFTCPNDIGISTDLYDTSIKVRYANARKELGMYYILDKSLSGDEVTFTWVLQEPTGRYDGTLYFNVTAEVSGDGGVEKRWNTRMAAIEVFKTLDDGSIVITPEQITEVDALIQELNGLIVEYNSVVAESEDLKDALMSSALSATDEGGGNVTLHAFESPVTSEWFQQYINSAKWLQGKTAIANGTDLNSLTAIGNYYVATAAIAASLTHAPVGDDALSITVERMLNSAACVKQTARCVSSGRAFTRETTDNGSTWTEWLPTMSLSRDPSNSTTFTFEVPRGKDSANAAGFNYFILVGGSQSHLSCWIGIVTVTVDSTPSIVLAPIAGNSYYTLTCTYTNEKTLTITANKTMYGGLRLIWLS